MKSLGLQIWIWAAISYAATPLSHAQSPAIPKPWDPNAPAPAASPKSPQSLDPGILFASSYREVMGAEKSEQSGDFLKALDGYTKAAKVFDYLATNYPNWQVNVVRNRQRSTRDAIARVRDKASEMASNRPSRNELVESGIPDPVGQIPSIRQPLPPTAPPIAPPTSPSIQPPTQTAKSLRELDLERQLRLAQDKIASLQASGQDVSLLQSQLSALQGRFQQATAEREIAEKRVADLERRLSQKQPDLPKIPENPGAPNADLAAQLNLTRAQLQKLSEENADLNSRVQNLGKELVEMRSARDVALSQRDNALKQLAETNPLRQQMEDMNRELTRSRLEIKAMARALKDTRLELETATTKLAKAEAGEAAFLQRVGELRNQMDTDRKANDGVTTALNNKLAQTEQQLAQANGASRQLKDQVTQLQRRLDETQTQLGEITSERDTLLTQRDQMAEMLRLNDPKAIKNLLDENTRLQHQLKLAQDNYDALAANAKSSRESLDAARTEIALLKKTLIDNRDENVGFRKRISELSDKLQLTQAQLEKASASASTNSAASEENILLREIVSRQLRVLAAREKARELVIASYKRLGINDQQMKDAVRSLADQDFTLSDDEKKLVDNAQDKPGVNGVLVAPGYGTPEERAIAQANLEQEMSALGRGAVLAYDKGRFAAAEQLFKTMLEVHPQHFASLVNLGTVQLKLEQPAQAIASFRDALDMNPEHPAPHFMLGVALYRIGQDAEAIKNFQEAAKLDPANAKAFVYLGNISWSSGDFTNAATFFEKAIGIDPKLREAHYNLVQVHLKGGHKAKAREAYDELIHAGFMPDAKLQAQLQDSSPK